ncbi:hypothetical protein ACRTDU_05615 [Sunxiuqinia elliptica]
MKRNTLYSIFLALLVLALGCEEDDIRSEIGPDIQVQEEYLAFDGLNVGETVSIPVNVKSENGIKRLSYFFITETANGTETSDAVHFDDPAQPTSIQKEISFEAVPKTLEMVLVAFDSYNKSSEIHIPFENIRELPSLSFTDNVDYRETVFENKLLNISGAISSEHEVEKISYATIVNNEPSSEQTIDFSNGESISFSAQVKVVKGLQGIIIKAENVYEGSVVDTFQIGAVVDDAVAITMENGITEISNLYAGQANSLKGTIASGSDLVSFSYAIKQNGSYGEETAIPLGTPVDEFPFEISLEGETGMQAVRFTGKNQNNNMLELELAIQRVNLPLVYLKDVELTTEIGAGKPNWFAAYQAPHIFDQSTAAQHQEMMDVALVVRGSALRFLSATVYEAGSYLPLISPYLEGFTQATYSVVTSNRGSITPESFSSLAFDEDLENFIQDKVIASKADGGENYNVAGTNRRTSSDLEANKGLIIGWGSYQDGKANNEQFALIYVKEVSLTDGIGRVKFDIKYPQPDYRTEYNPVSIKPYP